MNCKEGDLAIVVYSALDGDVGKVCKILWGFTHDGQQAWCVDPAPREGFGRYDAHMRPIRDNDGEDESLQWAPVPSRELVSSN